MILGLVLFFGVHLITTQREVRARFVAATGEAVYKAVYGLVSLAGLVLIAWGFAAYRKAGMIEVWEPLVPASVLTVLRHITVALMLPAVILVAASYIRGRIYVALKHPMLAEIGRASCRE